MLRRYVLQKTVLSKNKLRIFGMMALNMNQTSNDNRKMIEDFICQTEELLTLCRENVGFYSSIASGTEIDKRFEVVFDRLQFNIDKVAPLYKTIHGFAPEYDFDENHPGNGFRSFLFIASTCIHNIFNMASYIHSYKNNISFSLKRYQYIKNIEESNVLLQNLITCLEHLVVLKENTKDGNLFPSSRSTAKELLVKAHKIEQNSFYGRCLAFQFCKTMQPILRFISTSMAGFSKSYDYDGNTLTKTSISFYSSGKYYFDEEARAKRIVNISRNAGVDFCKAFWFLAENRFMYSLPSIYGSRVKCNRVFHIPPEPLQIKGTNGLANIPIPSSHIGTSSIKVRLLSNVERQGMVGVRKKNVKSKSSALIIHCHGGGFIACSSASHEVYLREWTINLNVPILSIDYSLAPQAPYPRALEEVFYVYCWALKNAHVLGTTCEKIILAGDSAGANLSICCTLKSIDFGLRRPDGIFMAYCPTIVDFIPSPARLLCLMDPLLPFGFLVQCLKAYSSNTLQIVKRNVIDENEQHCIQNQENNNLEASNNDETREYIANFRKKYAKGNEQFNLNIPVNEPEANENKDEKLKDEITVQNNDIELGEEANEQPSSFAKKFNRKILQLKTIMLPTMSKDKQRLTIKDMDNLMEMSASNDFIFEVPSDPFISPYYASPTMLEMMPAVKVVTTDLDPCLDDCISFAKKLKKSSKNSVDLDILHGLPHGFLNFVLVSREAHQGNLICIKRIQELIDN